MIDLESFLMPEKSKRYEWVSGDAVTADGIPFMCRKHKARLIQSNEIMNGKRELYCPKGDTIYREIVKPTF